MVVLQSRAFGNASLRLNRMSSFRSQSRGSSRGPRAGSLAATTRATEEVAVDLLPLMAHHDGYGVKLRSVSAPVHGAVERVGGQLRYRAPRLFVGEEEVVVELTDLFGVGARGRVRIEVTPHPAVGAPFEDGVFFDDETGWALD